VTGFRSIEYLNAADLPTASADETLATQEGARSPRLGVHPRELPDE
jgi:hypothetical protein